LSEGAAAVLESWQYQDEVECQLVILSSGVLMRMKLEFGWEEVELCQTSKFHAETFEKKILEVKMHWAQ
jgi:hypothetical protein